MRGLRRFYKKPVTRKRPVPTFIAACTGNIKPGVAIAMRKSVIYQVDQLSPEMRRAAEVLLGGTLDEDELITVRASKGRILKEATTGEVREESFRRLFDRIDRTEKQAEGVPDEVVDAAIDEAVDYVRHHRG